ncbi:MAG: bifunctional oligoribonuclease/PAP phosphatase NrnA [Cellulosilyticaceae bacterium]
MKYTLTNLVDSLTTNKIPAVTILGHDQIDEDSCISGLLLTHALNTLGITANFKILDPIIPCLTVNTLSSLGFNLDDYKGITSTQDYLILVDHYKSVHPGTVVACIDHHPTGQHFDYLFYDNDTSSACCKKIYNYMKEANFEITPDIVTMVVYGLMLDTFAFKSSRGTVDDKNWVYQMIETYHLDKSKIESLALRLTNVNQTVETLALTNLKSYVFGNAVVKSTYIQVNCIPPQLNEILAYLQHLVNKENINLWVFLLVDVANFKTFEYRITESLVEVIEHPTLTSRAQQIMPVIEKLFTA